jgi:hypothetical protein
LCVIFISITKRNGSKKIRGDPHWFKLLDRDPDPHPNMTDPDPREGMTHKKTEVRSFMFKVLDVLLGRFGSRSRNRSKCNYKKKIKKIIKKR